MAELNFCPKCGGSLRRHIVAGEMRNRWICQRCQEFHYDYPQIVVNCYVTHGKRLLWVKRGIEPRRGLWAIPGGFLELGESLTQGAARELWEEVGVQIAPTKLQFYMTGTVTFMNQVYIAFRAEVDSDVCTPGVESEECGFFSREECPWGLLGYPEVEASMRQAYDDLDRGEFGIWHSQVNRGGYSRWPVGPWS